MLRYLGAVAVIFLGASIAWMILGATLAARTADSDVQQTDRLSSQWGSAQEQRAPLVLSSRTKAAVPITSSRVNVSLDLEQRRKGLLWYNLYDVTFSARYFIRNDTGDNRLVVQFFLPSSDANYADMEYWIGGRRVDNAALLNQGKVVFDLAPGQETTLSSGYRSRGMGSWSYDFGSGVQSVNDFALTMTTNFQAIDFPPQTLLPVSERRSGNGWQLDWNYSTLVTSNGVGMAIPYPLQPGPLAQRITLWAPVALFFYLFVMLLVTTMRRIDLHPMNYFFLASAFFAFHLLFAYLVDRIPLEAAFVICSIVSIFLTVSYLRLVVGWRFAAIESGLAQLIYLVLFSYALFNEGWSGLTITVGAIITLFVAMQLTGRVRWQERFAAT